MSTAEPSDDAFAKAIEGLANQAFHDHPGLAAPVASGFAPAPPAAPPFAQPPVPNAALTSTSPSSVSPPHGSPGMGAPLPTLDTTYMGAVPLLVGIDAPSVALSPMSSPIAPRGGGASAAPSLAPFEPPGGPASPASFAAPSESATPYFLEIAGMPETSNGAAQTSSFRETSSREAAQSFAYSPETGHAVSVPREIFDPYAIKRDFPILQERVHGKQLVWLDNAATTQKPRAVIERLAKFYERENSNVHRAAHTLAARATDAYEGARDTVRRFLNAPSSKDIVFVRGATEAINLVAQSWGRRNVKEGDEIVVTHLEHHANIVPWQRLCAETGAKLKVAPVNDAGEIIVEEYEKLFTPRTRLAAFTQVSNALGPILPAKLMVDIAHRHGARVLLDGAQAVSHMPVDVQELDCDFYVLSGHKIFAPTGIGALFGKADILENMPPWQGGGNMIADVTFEKTLYQPPPWRFEAGTGNIADAVGLGAALDYLSEIGLENVSEYEHGLRLYGEACLSRIEGLHIIGNAKDKAGVISFVLDGVKTEEVGGMLDQEGIAVRSGHHCAQPILRRFGVEATVRASLAPYNTKEDLDALAAAVRRIMLNRRA